MYPHPAADWVGLKRIVTERNTQVFCPLDHRMRPWIHVGDLTTAYGPGGCCSIM